MLIYLNKQPPKRRKAPKSPRTIRAVNEALRKAEEMMEREMKKLNGGMNIPGLF